MLIFEVIHRPNLTINAPNNALRTTNHMNNNSPPSYIQVEEKELSDIFRRNIEKFQNTINANIENKQKK